MYRKKGTLRSVDATRPPDEVTEAILDALGD
jgi:adenylate kinase family enzyme